MYNKKPHLKTKIELRVIALKVTRKLKKKNTLSRKTTNFQSLE